MERVNFTLVIKFTLLGFSETQGLRVLFFTLFLGIYLLTLLGNATILLTIHLSPQLHSPMYYFLSELSLLDVCYSTSTIPKMLAGFVNNSQRITYRGCVAQLYFFHFFGGTECFLLTVMAFDRYVAICNPLRYSSIMSKMVCTHFIAGTCLIGTVHSTIQTVLTFRLSYCGPYELEHYFCDVPPLLKVACADTSVNKVIIMFNVGVVALSSLLLIMGSYVRIVATIVTMCSEEGKRKAFSTCTAHLIVVLTLYVPCILIYLQPAKASSVQKVMAVFYTAITPAMNPLIYSLRSEEIKRAVKKLVFRKMFS
ncbi:olfactory receptor 10G4-like [Rhineura floridana]|uniref:olfactory receptor 10G4-like n=1 Tax=Rhineura floridana TaxID=261503 RepID=UPI002AC826B4|nr:olfactory receptor 10G4-like [Rhineura floridana]